MKLSVEEVRYIARLAKLSFTQFEEQKLLKDFEDILSHFEAIESIDLSDVKADPYLEAEGQFLSSDEPAVFEDRDKLFLNTSSMLESFIKVPRIIE